MKRLKIAIVGLNFGTHIIQDLTNGDGRKYFQIAAVCDRDRSKAESVGRSLSVTAHCDIETLLADEQIQTICLFTPPNGRAELVGRIIRSGKDVMTTKPFELDVSAAKAVLKEARRRKRIIHLNSPSPLPSADLKQIACWWNEFDLGRPVGARADAWANYREKSDGSWYDDPNLCPGAPIFRLGIYVINDLIRLFGPAVQVQIGSSRLITKRPTPDNAQLGILFKNGALANVYSSFCIDDGQAYRNALVLNFERGTIYRNAGPFPRLPGTETQSNLALITRNKIGHPIIRRKMVNGCTGDYQWRIFHEMINGARLPTEGMHQEILGGVKILAAMRRAESSGRPEKV